MARPRKSQHLKHGQPKSAQVATNITPDGKAGLAELAESLGLSVGELLDQIGRGQIKIEGQQPGE